ncbi:MAG: MATE family efflux transporter [Adlercreutzia sp.]
MSVDMSKHFSTSALIRFTLPTIAMMIFTSCYTIVDGFFVSNYAGKTALAAVNLIVPAVMILASVGMMIGTGGSALVAKTGRGRPAPSAAPFLAAHHLRLRRGLGALPWRLVLHGAHGHHARRHAGKPDAP